MLRGDWTFKGNTLVGWRVLGRADWKAAEGEHNASGAGSQILALDLNKDGINDIVTSGELGAFAFFGKPRSKAAAVPAAR